MQPKPLASRPKLLHESVHRRLGGFEIDRHADPAHDLGGHWPETAGERALRTGTRRERGGLLHERPHRGAAGEAGHIEWDLVPAIVYTDPEVASVGLGEDAAKNRGLAVRVGKFNFAANGRALASDAADGFVKLIADATTDRLLGAQILGRGAGELISEVVAHMSYGGSAEDLARTIHAHPTMSEAVKEAALAVSKCALHTM